MVIGGGKAFLAGGGQKTITLRSQVAHSLARGIFTRMLAVPSFNILDICIMNHLAFVILLRIRVVLIVSGKEQIKHEWSHDWHW